MNGLAATQAKLSALQGYLAVFMGKTHHSHGVFITSLKRANCWGNQLTKYCDGLGSRPGRG